jgi:hypothetical protein
MRGNCGREDKSIKGFRRGNLQESDYLKYLGIDGRITQRWILKK